MPTAGLCELYVEYKTKITKQDCEAWRPSFNTRNVTSESVFRRFVFQFRPGTGYLNYVLVVFFSRLPPGECRRTLDDLRYLTTPFQVLGYTTII